MDLIRKMLTVDQRERYVVLPSYSYHTRIILPSYSYPTPIYSYPDKYTPTIPYTFTMHPSNSFRIVDGPQNSYCNTNGLLPVTYSALLSPYLTLFQWTLPIIFICLQIYYIYIIFKFLVTIVPPPLLLLILLLPPPRPPLHFVLKNKNKRFLIYFLSGDDVLASRSLDSQLVQIKKMNARRCCRHQ